MRELVINAFAHRSYLEHDAPVFLAIYDNRVEITSPGGLPRGQTADRALAGYSKIRNDILAKALNYMRYIEEWGSGLRRVNRVLAEYGIRFVAIDEVAFATQMNVYRIGAPDHEGNEGNHDPNAPNRAPNGTNCGTDDTNCEDNRTGCEDNRADNEDNRDDNVGVAELILGRLKSNTRISVRQLASELPISKATVERNLRKLQIAGRIRRKGGTRGVWEVL